MSDFYHFGLLAGLWLVAFCLDQLLGETPRFHPLAGFGRLAGWLEKRLNSGPSKRYVTLAGVVAGIVAWCVMVLPPVLLTHWIGGLLAAQSLWLFWGFSVLVLYLAIAWRSMAEHVIPIVVALSGQDLEEARRRLGYIVSRDTQELTAAQILTATLETTLENCSDAFFASLFWCAVAGPAGVVLHRLSNTLDAMWGYRSARFLHFGHWSARVDDVLNFIPAQLTAGSFALLSAKRVVWQCWWRQGWHWKSINAGSVMAAGAAALGIELGGAARYHDQQVIRPALGAGRSPEPADVGRAMKLVFGVFTLWLAVLLVLGGLYSAING